MILSILCGAAIYENYLFFLIISRAITGVFVILALISTLFALIYSIVILIYLFKGRQDGSTAKTLTIIGIIQAVVITGFRIYMFIILLMTPDPISYFVYFIFVLLSTLVGAAVSIAQPVV